VAARPRSDYLVLKISRRNSNSSGGRKVLLRMAMLNDEVAFDYFHQSMFLSMNEPSYRFVADSQIKLLQLKSEQCLRRLHARSPRKSS